MLCLAKHGRGRVNCQGGEVLMRNKPSRSWLQKRKDKKKKMVFAKRLMKGVLLSCLAPVVVFSGCSCGRCRVHCCWCQAWRKADC